MKRSLLRRGLARLGDWTLDTAVRYAMRGEAWKAYGIEIRVRLVRGAPLLYAERVGKALGLIERYDPPRLARIQRDLRAIVVSPFVAAGVAAEYNRRYRLCLLASTDFLEQPLALIALWIVHEATHARLASMPVTQANIRRIERLCTSQELAFATRLPGSDLLQALLREAVEQTGTIDYSKAGFKARALESLKQQGVPVAVLSGVRRIADYLGDSGESAAPPESVGQITIPPPNER